MSASVYIISAAIALALFIILIVILNRIRSRDKRIAREKSLEVFRNSFVLSGMLEPNADQLARLQLYLKEEKLKEGPLRDIYQMRSLLKTINGVCESIELNPDKKAKIYLQDIALSLMAQIKIKPIEGKDGIKAVYDYWYNVIYNLTIPWRHLPQFDLNRFTEQLIFFAFMANAHKSSLTVPEYEDYVIGLARICETEECEERWEKWLMEDGTFKGLLDSDLKRFSDAGEISYEFSEYFRKFHIRPVVFLLKKLAYELAFSQMKKSYFPNGDVQVSNEAYADMARAYTTFSETLLER